MKNVVKTKSIDPEKFALVDRESGEELPFRKGQITKKEEMNLFNISYDEYVYLDTKKVVDYCEKGLKFNQLGLLGFLSSKIQFFTNACLDVNSEPLSTKSISEMIGKSINATKGLLNELELIGLIWYGKIPEYRKKVYVLNPHFIRKGKEFKKTTVQHFYQVSGNPKKNEI